MNTDIKLRNKMTACKKTDDIPITFAFGGVPAKGIPEELRPVTKRHTSDSAVITTEYSAVASKGMIITARETLYSDFPVVHWEAEITSRGKTDSEILTDFAVSVYVNSPAVSTVYSAPTSCALQQASIVD